MAKRSYEYVSLELVLSSLLLLISIGTTFSFVCFKFYIKHLRQMKMLNIVIASILVLKFSYEVQEKAIAESLLIFFWTLIYIFILSFFIAIAFACCIYNLLEKFRFKSKRLFTKKKNKPSTDSKIIQFAEWSRPREIDTIQILNIFNILLFLVNGLVACMATTRPTLSNFKTFLEPNFTFYLVPILTSLLNYYLVSRWQWIKFYRDDTIRTVSSLEPDSIKHQRIVFRFFMCSFTPILPRFFWSDFKDAVCTIDLEDKPTTFFCSNHMFHVDCMLGHLSNKCEQILDNCRFHKKNRRYEIRLFQKYMPKCPNCATFWEANSISVKVENKFNRLVECDVVIKNDDES